MPVVTIPEAAVAANTKTAEQLAGTQIAYGPKNGALRVWAAASAVGCRHTLMVGGETVIDDQEISAIRAAGVGIDNDADFVITVGVRSGEQVRYFFRNATGVAITTKAKFEYL